MTNATDTSKTLGESMFAQCGYAQDAIDKRVSPTTMYVPRV